MTIKHRSKIALCIGCAQAPDFYVKGRHANRSHFSDRYLLITATVLIHYETLRFTGRLLPSLPIRPRQRVLVVIAACFVAHLLEIALYAGAFALLHDRPGLGRIDGEFDATALDFFYFSITSYTTLGVGDAYPRGPLRVLAGVEALNGFLLITWSASFTYLMMQRHWHPERDK